MLTPILDTHQHLIYPGALTYSWTAGIPALAGRAFTVQDYEEQRAGTGIVGALFMETSPDAWQQELSLIERKTSEPASPVRGFIANCRPEHHDSFAAYLDSIDTARLAGVRRICHVEPDELSQTPEFVASIRLLAERSLPFDLCLFPRQLAIGELLARRCPDTQFVLDHCGVPDIAAAEFDTWSAALRRLAALPNVCCKLSGLPAYCAPGAAGVSTIRPYFEHAIELFGWERVVWGSDWPVCTQRATLQEWIGISREIVAHESEENRRKLFHENALRIYRLGDGSKYWI